LQSPFKKDLAQASSKMIKTQGKFFNNQNNRKLTTAGKDGQTVVGGTTKVGTNDSMYIRTTQNNFFRE